jgi:hypothetical protein
MKTATLNEVRNSLSTLTNKELIGMILRMARYRKENKELLTYLLYYTGDESGYIQSVKDEVDQLLTEINRSNSYFALKGIRKTLRLTNKFIRYSTLKQTEVELLIHFCMRIRQSGVLSHPSIALGNLYQRQILKIEKSISALHEDLQFDYGEELKRFGI